jgi:hypothetical protein
VGLYKLCDHKGRARDRCAHAWWAQFRKVRVSLEKWANREIDSKTDADMAFDDLKTALAIGTTIEYRLRPLMDHFGNWPLAEIKTADVEDFIADLRKPKIAGRRKKPRTLSPASINRTIEIMRHMMN